jgi:hypothetical protein
MDLWRKFRSFDFAPATDSHSALAASRPSPRLEARGHDLSQKS